MAGEDLAALGIKVDASQSDVAAKSLDNLTAAGGRVEQAIGGVNTSTDRLRAQLQAAGLSVQEINKYLDVTEVQAKATATSLAGIGPAVTSATSATALLNASLGITDTAFKSATASAAVFGTSLAGLSALDAATVKVSGLSKEMLALKAVQDGANFNATISGVAGIGRQYKSASESAAVFGEAQKIATLRAQEAGLVFYNQINSLLGIGKATKSASESASVFSAAFKTESKAAAAAVSAGADSQVASHGRVIGSALKIRETFVIIREAIRGDFSRMAGSASILAGAFGLISGPILAIAVPIAILVGGFIALEIAVARSIETSRKLEAELAGIGRVAGVTSTQIEDASKATSAAQNISIGKARELALVYATSGKVSGDILKELTLKTLSYAEATGQTTVNAAKELATAFADPAKGAENLNEKLNFLNLTQLTHIQQLADEGNRLGAQQALYAALDQAIDNTSQNHVTGLVAAWRDVARWAGNAYDAMVVAAGGGSLTAQLQKRKNDLADLQGSITLGRLPGIASITGYDDAVKKAKDDIASLENEIAKATVLDAYRAGQAAKNRATTDAAGLIDKANPERTILRELETQYEKLGKAKKAAQDAGLSDSDIIATNHAFDAARDALGRVTEAYAKYGNQAGIDHQIALDKAAIGATTDRAEKGRLTTEVALLKAGKDLITNQEALTRAEDAGNIVADKHVKTNNYKLDSAAAQLRQTQLLVDQQVTLNKQVADGTLSSAEAARQIQITANARRIEAIAEGTSGALKEKLLAIVEKLIIADKQLFDARDDAHLQASNDNEQQHIDLLREETRVIGQNNLAQAEAIALLRAKQQLTKDYGSGFDPKNPTADQQRAIDLARENAKANVELKGTTDAYNSSLSLQSTLMDEIAAHAQAMSAGLSGSFGTVGTAIDKLTVAFTSYSATQAKIAEDQTRLDKLRAAGTPDIAKEIELRKKQGNVDTEYYADVLGAAKSFFSQGSSGYKVLQAAETAYRAYQLVSSITAIAAKWGETSAVVAANTVQTASSATTAVANAAADVPFPFNLGAIATIVAVLAGFGILAGGGGGAAPVPPVDIAKDRQAAQGAGSVLGDSAAKSDSIAKSLDELSKNTNRDLEYSNQMVVSLKAIQSGIGSLTALLARQLKVGGLFDTASLGLGTSSSSNVPGLASIPLLGGIANSLFGSSSSNTTLLDQGIKIAGTTIGAAVADGIAANAYQTTKTDSHSSALFGLISSSSSSTATKNTALSSDFTSTIEDIVKGLRTTVLDAATKLGVEGAQAVVDSLSLNIGNISFKDMTGSQIQDALNQVFSALGDQLAEAAIPVVKQLQQVGEGALQTLSRLAQEYMVVEDASKTVGFTFSKLGVDSIVARDRLVQMSGGLDNFASQASFFVSNFETSSQTLRPIIKAVNDEMTRLGLTGITTKTQFAQIVQAIDASTAGGAALYAALQNVAPAFAKVADAAEQLANQRRDLEIKLLQDEGDAIGATALQREKELKALDDSLKPLQLLIYAYEDLNSAQANLTAAQKALVDAQKAANQVMQTSIDKFKGFVTSLTAFQQALVAGPLANNGILRQYAVSKSVFNATASAAASGDPVALSQLQQSSSDFLTASKASSINATQYARDLAAVKAAVSAGTKAAQNQVDINTQQLYAINDVNNSVLSVADAIANLTKVQAAYNVAALAVASAKQNYANNISSPAANDNMISDVAALVANAIDKGGITDNSNAQSSYDAALQSLDSIASSALNLLHSAGVYAEWSAKTNVPGGDIGSFAVGNNLFTDPSLSGVLSQFQNMQSQYISLFKTAQDLFSQIPSHASGLSYVPRDGYVAKLHKGERVMTANENQSGGDSISEIRAMRAEMRAIGQQTQTNTRMTNNLLRKFSQDGNSISVKVVG